MHKESKYGYILEFDPEHLKKSTKRVMTIYVHHGSQIKSIFEKTQKKNMVYIQIAKQLGKATRKARRKKKKKRKKLTLKPNLNLKDRCLFQYRNFKLLK